MRNGLMTLRAWLRALKVWPLYLFLFALGALSVLAHAPYHIQPALIIALSILVWCLDDARKTKSPVRAGFMRAWLFASGQFLAGTYWVTNAFLVSPDDHLWLIWAPLILFPAGLGLFWALAGGAYIRLAPKGPGRVIIFAVLFTAIEYARSTVLSGFPWNLPAYVFQSGTPISQIASQIGPYGLSFLVLLSFASPAALIGSGKQWQKLLPGLTGLVLLSACWMWGSIRLDSAVIEENATRLRLVQLNTPQSEWAYEARYNVLEDYLALTGMPGLNEIDIVIWPEGAIPTYLLTDEKALDRIYEVLPSGTRLVAGTPRYQNAEAGKTGKYYNAMVVLQMSDRVYLEASYNKSRLVPFGESNPLHAITRWFGIESLSYWNTSYTPGSGAGTLRLSGIPAFTPMICYEVVYPGFTPTGKNRPEWILNISNDSWYGNRSGPTQHYNQVGYRAIETGLPIVRSASSGISGLIDSYGRSATSLKVVHNDMLDISLQLSLDNTSYELYSEIPWMIVMILIVIGLLYTTSSRSKMKLNAIKG